jgi:hypothetical protein|tara:strand:+ start:328 stop:507 length:180 start_codon:yes stop_codon:yes gene_type:complete
MPTTDELTPQQLYHEVEMLTDAMVVENEDFEPLTSSEIRENVAQLIRQRFYVIEGGLNG